MALVIVILLSSTIALSWARSIARIDPMLVEYYKEIERSEESG